MARNERERGSRNESWEVRKRNPMEGRVGYYPNNYGGYSDFESQKDMEEEIPPKAFRSYRMRPTERRYYGLGPKGYQRSEGRILEDINDLLTYNNDIDASHIEVEVRSGEVFLRGTVEDRQQKKMAEQVAESVRGVEDVHNEIRLERQSRH